MVVGQRFLSARSKPFADSLLGQLLKTMTDEHGVQYRPITSLTPAAMLAATKVKPKAEIDAVVGGHSAPCAILTSRSSQTAVPASSADVVVVGGGFSGVQAAWDLQRAGLSCMLLEAKHRIGGRSHSQKLKSGPGVVELGATWINRTTSQKSMKQPCDSGWT